MTAGRIPRRVSVNPNRAPALGHDEIADRAQAHPAPERRALHADDERHRAGVDGLEHVGHRHGVLLVAFHIERHRRPHPGDVGAGAERGAVAGEDHGPERGGLLAGKRREGRPQLGDDRRIEGVVQLRACERDSGDDVARDRCARGGWRDSPASS